MYISVAIQGITLFTCYNPRFIARFDSVRKEMVWGVEIHVGNIIFVVEILGEHMSPLDGYL